MVQNSWNGGACSAIYEKEELGSKSVRLANGLQTTTPPAD